MRKVVDGAGFSGGFTHMMHVPGAFCGSGSIVPRGRRRRTFAGFRVACELWRGVMRTMAAFLQATPTAGRRKGNVWTRIWDLAQLGRVKFEREDLNVNDGRNVEACVPEFEQARLDASTAEAGSPAR